MGSYVCKIVCQFVGWGYVCYWVSLLVGWGLSLVLGLSVCWWLRDNIISFKSRDGVNVEFFIIYLNKSHGF